MIKIYLNRKILVSLLLALGIIISVVAIPYVMATNDVDDVNNLDNQNKTFYSSQDLNLNQIEVADNNRTRAQGLMFRSDLCDECAMIFIYNYPTKSGFWMKNTQVSLDIIFMDDKGKIINYHEYAEPLNTQKIYYPEASYMFALEAKAGFVKKYKLAPGKIIDVKSLILKAKNYKLSK